MNKDEVKIAVVGLGYVGLPLAVAFAEAGVAVIGFDIDQKKIDSIKIGNDPSGEVLPERLTKSGIDLTADPKKINEANFIIIAVPTPITEDKKPDLSIVEDATKTVGENLSPGSVVVFESTVYPGVTEDVCLPILKKVAGHDEFTIGYSPERINPGDSEHGLAQVIKIVSGQDEATLDRVAEVYELVCKAGVHRAQSIKVAEASKVIENVQRDLNIALVNELSLIFDKLDIDTAAVLEAAGTKWNFHHYHPGLVGGHCIGIDPYYLVHAAKEAGYDPQVILSGREINDGMAKHVAQMMVDALGDAKDKRVLVMGQTFKENVPDPRNSKAKEVAQALTDTGAEVVAHDPFIDQYNQELAGLKDFDAIALLVAHDDYKKITLEQLKSKTRVDSPILFDLRRVHDKDEAEKLGFTYLSL
ncbi:UDP-N-acetyl-D-galactosamine dehydrogenase [bacterium]|nr:UDP-N-acetyl-D-galactosamine dehydrogenase [bacterium]